MQILSALRRSTLALVLALTAAAGGQSPPGDGFQDRPPDGGGRMGPGGPGGETRKILEKFDKNDNGRLDGAERDAAREELKKTPQRAGGGRGGMRGPGGMPGGLPGGMPG